MKTKQRNIRAHLGAQDENARNYSGKKEQIERYVIVDKRTERTIVDCRVWLSGSTVYASIWVNGDGFWSSGRGSAGGGGYHKNSAAIGDAIASAGIEMYGDAYVNADKVDFKKLAYIGGVGETAIDAALLAIAHACGFNNVVYMKG